MQPELVALLKYCVPKTSTFGFFTLSPWIPGAKKLRERIHQQFASTSECDGSLAGYFDAQKTDVIDELFDIRTAFGGNKSGEWGVGGCTVNFSEPKRLSFAKRELWDFAHILAEAEKLSSFLYLGDGYTTFMTKCFDDFDAALAQYPQLAAK